MARRKQAGVDWLSDTRALLVGVRCQCGGEVQLDDMETHDQWRYEVFCRDCKRCDPNGYGSLRAAVPGGRAYFPPLKKD